MVNVGTGNLLLQQDDMAAPHKGIALAFRRTYNSQAAATSVPGYWTPWTSLYGNGWTNTFDAHIVATSATQKSVYDVDGARYDYVSNGNGYTSLTPGQHAVLAWDHACGMTWTKKNGTTYYFYLSNPASSCPSISPLGGYAGRLYQIIGRNRNTYITFSYAWDNGDASVNGKISAITATTESGMSATLSFADVNGRRLLQTLTFPDGSTNVQYYYDTNGNMIYVSRPPNNASGTRSWLNYGYTTIGNDQILFNYASPRWCGNPIGCGYDGAWVLFLFNGTSAATSTFSEFSYAATVNPTINDGTNTPLYSGYQPAGLNYSTLRTEFYTTGMATPTYRDTDGHMTNWVVDGLGRPTQTQECTASANQGQQCTGTWLVTNESWDADNNLVSESDPRGYETDYAYDTNGNTIAVGEPARTTSEGTFRPTRLYDYDANNNVLAYCDQSETNQAGANWSSAPSPSDTLCSSHNVPQARFVYSHPTYEPYGELTTITTPLGYNHRIGYDVSKQGGTDYGLPTDVSGDPVTQLDGTTVTPSQTFWYDANGSLRCYSKGVGISVLSYDANNRMTAVADPDDSSMNTGALCGKTSGQPGWNTRTTFTYYPDGSKATVQSPSERAFGVSSSYTYDLDGNEITETTHHGCVPGQPCPDGRTTKWYDGADRLVEVGPPHDPRSFTYPTTAPYDHGPSFTRYLYDLSQGGTVSVDTSGPIRAYGNLYKTLVAPSGTSSWYEKAGSQFDALDREVNSYSWQIGGPSGNTLQTTRLVYDQDASTLGLLAQKVNPASESVTYAYNAANKVSSEAYANDGSRTANETYVYDAVGRPATTTSSQFGTQTNAYDADGRLLSIVEPNGGGVSDPATIQYSYYANGMRSAVSVTSATFNQSNALAYSYRADGLLQTQSINAFASGSWNRQYTDAGRSTNTNGVDMRARSYDATGQLLSDTMRGNAITFTHDPEGSVLTESFPTLTYATAINYTYDVRGELIDWYSGTSPGSGNDERLLWAGDCGVRTAIPPNLETYSPGDQSMDVRTCAAVTSGQIYQTEYNNAFYPYGTTNIVSYDAAGRMVHNTTHTAAFASPEQVDAAPQSQNVDGSGGAAIDWSGVEVGKTSAWGGGHTFSSTPREVTTTRTADTLYDAENHTVSRGGSSTWSSTVVGQSGTSTPAPSPTPTTTLLETTLGWGPNGHPAIAYGGTTRALTFHWDGNAILFVTDVNGNVVDFKAGLDGEVAPADSNWTGLIVFDRDQAGVVIDTATPTRNLYSPGDGDGNPPEAMGTMMPLYAPYYRTDGFYVGDLQINGVRAFDPAVGTWTTPDAYEGDIHDPMSQQKYVFNGNNGIDYSDPSGYCTASGGTETAPDGKQRTLQAIGCVDAKPVAPGDRLMSDGRSVREHIHNQQVFLGALSEGMMWVLPVGGEAKAGITLYRAVGSAELADIVRSGAYRLAPGNEVKYFYPTIEQAQKFAQMLTKQTGDEQVVTSGVFHRSNLPDPIHIAGEGMAHVLDAGHFPHGPVRIFK